ncbi:cupin domain-containing protein [Thermoflavimicrobium dichotomicum]|uniref:Mannose-6-phosphate isomerase, cupin superfamily n=1 Tax=Thermoflavimicrobium dichotomicum TaxID=46223 RepID=A0A1I3P358_9BACL|nr:cupin domain-containing protein [Thermoflavimicrobium dichotomicum]SFJ15995.1 Mannose-6-phosphate isomerase, cupin superfamily [Thermoflavimicrobium dichotomicum]
MKISKKIAEHYKWGNDCDGWYLMKRQDLSIIHEHMPPHTSEVRHYHEWARQFFFVLKGEATIEIDGKVIQLEEQEGVEVPPRVPHQMMNVSDEPVEFLVISQPTSKGDRILAEATSGVDNT